MRKIEQLRNRFSGSWTYCRLTNRYLNSTGWYVEPRAEIGGFSGDEYLRTRWYAVNEKDGSSCPAAVLPGWPVEIML